MALCVWGVIFFAVTFVPRFFTLMNFGYGYADLGLYSQMLAALSRGQFNPVLLTYGKTYLQVKPQPWIYFLFPISFVTTSPAVILFLDEVAILFTAFVCARFAWKRFQSRPLESGICLAVLFSALTMNSLHAPSRVTVWAQAPLALLMVEYFLRRRPGPMVLWFSVLCLLDLHFGALAGLLVPLVLITQSRRWNFQRRLLVALPLAFIGALSLTLLHLWGGGISLNKDLFWQVEGSVIITWLISFWFLPLLNLEIVLVALFLMALNLNGGIHDPSLLVPLGALGVVKTLELLDFKEQWLRNLISAGLVATAFYYNLVGGDPFFSPWSPAHRSLLTENKALHDMIAHVPPDRPVLVSDRLSPHLANNPSMAVLSAAGARSMVPDYIISVNEPTSFDKDPRFQVMEINSDLGARLLKRIK